MTIEMNACNKFNFLTHRKIVHLIEKNFLCVWGQTGKARSAGESDVFIPAAWIPDSCHIFSVCTIMYLPISSDLSEELCCLEEERLR